jgi:hypothetical protein
MKLHKSKRSVVSCYEAKISHSAIEISCKGLSTLQFPTGNNELNYDLRAKNIKTNHENSVWCVPEHPCLHNRSLIKNSVLLKKNRLVQKGLSKEILNGNFLNTQ